MPLQSGAGVHSISFTLILLIKKQLLGKERGIGFTPTWLSATLQYYASETTTAIMSHITQVTSNFRVCRFSVFELYSF